MAFEITFYYHPRKEEGVGYDTTQTQENTIKIGKPFDDTPMDKLVGVIMSQMARRDVLVIDVKIDELVRKSIQFKECKDGKGVVLNNKRYTFSDIGQMVAEDVGVALPAPVPEQSYLPQPAQQPHELARQNLDRLYSNPNTAVPVVRQTSQQPVNQKRVMYEVYFEPEAYLHEAKRMKLKFQLDKKYPVHQIVPHPSGKLDAQKIAITDDTGKVVTVDEKFFVAAGQGLMADQELHFSETTPNRNKPRLAFDDELVGETVPDIRKNGRTKEVSLDFDDEAIDEMPELRPGRKYS